MSVKDQILYFIDSQELTVSGFERRSGLANGYVQRFKGNIGAGKLESILKAYPEINRDWLLTGEGEMLKTSDLSLDRSGDIVMIPLLPIAAQGGLLNNFAASVKTVDCEKIVSPIRGIDFAMSISGDSMDPEYPSGSKILIKKINEKAFIEWGRVYVLDTCNGSVIKKLFPSSTSDAVSCVSINTHYPPFQVSFEDIYGIYRVLMLLSEK